MYDVVEPAGIETRHFQTFHWNAVALTSRGRLSRPAESPASRESATARVHLPAESRSSRMSALGYSRLSSSRAPSSESSSTTKQTPRPVPATSRNPREHLAVAKRTRSPAPPSLYALASIPSTLPTGRYGQLVEERPTRYVERLTDPSSRRRCLNLPNRTASTYSRGLTPTIRLKARCR